MIPLNGTINDTSFIRREIVQSFAWLRDEMELQIKAGIMTEADAVALFQEALAFWQPKIGTELEAWQA